MFTFPCATNQARALTFEGTFELHKNLAGRNKIGLETFDKAKKKDFTVNKPDEDKDQALESAREGDVTDTSSNGIFNLYAEIRTCRIRWHCLKLVLNVYNVPFVWSSIID